MLEEEITIVSLDLAKAEYDNLNKEISDNSAKVFQVILFCTGGVGAILSWVLAADVTRFPLGAKVYPFALIFLPALIILPSIILIETCLRSSARIAGYIEVFYEGSRNGLHWQQAVQQYRKKFPSKRGLAKSLLWVFRGLSFVSLTASLFAVVGVADFTHKQPVYLGVAYLCFYLAAVFLFVGAVWILLIDLCKCWKPEYFDDQVTFFKTFAETLTAVARHRKISPLK
jgi:hypothetical protein